MLKEIGPKHARLRPPLAVSYSRQMASPHVPAMIAAVRHEVRSWPPGTPLEVVTRVKALAFAEYRVLLGSPRITFRDCLLMTDYLMNVAARLFPPVVFKAPWYRRAHTRTYGALTELVRHAGAPRGPATLRPPLSTRWPARAIPQVRSLTEDEVVSYAAYGVGASIGYVGRLTSFMLYEILRDPDLHAQVVAEAQAAFARPARRHRRAPPAAPSVGVRRDAALPLAGHRHGVRRRLGVPVPRTPRRPGGFLVLSPVPSSYAPASFPDPYRFDPARCREPRNEHRRRARASPSAWAIARARRWAWWS